MDIGRCTVYVKNIKYDTYLQRVTVLP